MSSFLSVMCANVEELVDCGKSDFNNNMRTLALPISMSIPHFTNK